MTRRILVAAAACVALFAASGEGVAQTERLSAVFGGQTIGHLTATTPGSRVLIDYDYKTSAKGLPSAWTIKGATVFGNAIDESFGITGTRAEWRDSTGPGSVTSDGEAVCRRRPAPGRSASTPGC